MKLFALLMSSLMMVAPTFVAHAQNFENYDESLGQEFDTDILQRRRAPREPRPRNPRERWDPRINTQLCNGTFDFTGGWTSGVLRIVTSRTNVLTGTVQIQGYPRQYIRGRCRVRANGFASIEFSTLGLRGNQDFQGSVVARNGRIRITGTHVDGRTSRRITGIRRN